MNPNDIEEGDDVYFGCDVDANPPAYKVLWEHNVSINIFIKNYMGTALENLRLNKNLLLDKCT